MSQVMLIGISGLDADLLRVYGPSLPNLRRLMLESPFLELESTIPPEPGPAWASVYTGLNPANHGLLTRIDCLQRAAPESLACCGECFWEQAARAGKQVCVLNPLLGGRGTSGSALLKETLPALLDEPQLPPASQLHAFCHTLQERTERQVVCILDVFARHHWDLFFAQLDALDYVQHFLWRYSDPGDPLYPGKNEHANRILDFYRFFDSIVGRLRSATDGACIFGVVSSHGHERRSTSHLHINAWLREQGLLMPQRPVSVSCGCSSALKHCRQIWPGMQDLCSSLARLWPGRGNPAGAPAGIDHAQTVAQMVELASSSSSYAGIRINRELLACQGRDYELVCEAIVRGLVRLSIKESPVVNWAKRREQCYQGRYLQSYPDILFELRSDFGVGRNLATPLVSPDSTQRLVSGTHSAHGVFLVANWPAELEPYQDFRLPSVMDVAPTLLCLCGVAHSALDGQALVHLSAIRQLI
jgi:predicted AlkP superfamily phosphohydrolase/phosphomutase